MGQKRKSVERGYQEIRTTRYIELRLNIAAVAELLKEKIPLFLSWNQDMKNGMPDTCYMVLPRATDKFIQISFKDDGSGYQLYDNKENKNPDCVQLQIRVNFSPYYSVQRLNCTTTLEFQIVKRSKDGEGFQIDDIGVSQIPVLLKCCKEGDTIVNGLVLPICSSSNPDSDSEMPTTPKKSKVTERTFNDHQVRSAASPVSSPITSPITTYPITYPISSPISTSTSTSTSSDLDSPLSSPSNSSEDQFGLLEHEFYNNGETSTEELPIMWPYLDLLTLNGLQS